MSADAEGFRLVLATAAAPSEAGRGSRKRLLLVILAPLIAAIVVLAAIALWLRPIGPSPPPTNDVNTPQILWRKDPTQPGTELIGSGPIVGLTFRVVPRAFEPPADRLYVAMPQRLYAIKTWGANPADRTGLNAWGTLQYFNVSSIDNAADRTISVPPVAMNYGDYTSAPADYEVYLGTSDGRLFILRDRGNHVPAGDDVAQLNLTDEITGLALYNGDTEAPEAIRGAANHLYFNSTSWTHERLPSNGDLGEFASLAVNGSGGALLAYYDYSTGRPAVSVRGPNGQWVSAPQIESYRPNANVGNFTSLATGSDGRPRIAYHDQARGALKFAAFNGTSWTVTTVDAGPDVGRYASLRLGASNEPHIAYYNTTAKRLQYAQFRGGAWAIEVPDPSSNATGEYASLALDAIGNPRIGYYDATARTLKFVAKDGATPWQAPETVDASSDDVGTYASLAVDAATGQPHIAYYDVTAKALRYATRTAAWSASFVDWTPGVDVGRYASIALDPTGRPAIAYHDATSLNLKFARFGGSTWTVQTLRSEGNTGLYTSFAFDPLGQPHVGYRSYESGRTEKDLVVAGTAAGEVYGIDVGVPKTIQESFRERHVATWDYRVRWVVRESGEAHLADVPMNPPAPVPQFSPAFARNGTLAVVGLATGTLLALNTSTGSVAWRHAIPGTSWTSAPVAYRDADTMDERILAAGDDGRLSVFRAETGELLGTRTIATSALLTPTVSGGTVYASTTGGELHSVRLGMIPPPEFLTDQWTNRLSGPASGSIVTLSRLSLVLAADEAGRLHAFRMDGKIESRGHLCDSITAGPALWTTPPPSIQPSIWLGCRDGSILAVSIQRG